MQYICHAPRLNGNSDITHDASDEAVSSQCGVRPAWPWQAGGQLADAAARDVAEPARWRNTD